MDRRAFIGLTIAIPTVVVAERHYRKKAPRDTDDRKYDKWLDEEEDYGKDEMHL